MRCRTITWEQAFVTCIAADECLEAGINNSCQKIMETKVQERNTSQSTLLTANLDLQEVEKEDTNSDTAAKSKNYSCPQDSLLVYIPNIKEELEIDEEQQLRIFTAGCRGGLRSAGEEPLNLVVRGSAEGTQPIFQQVSIPEDEAGDPDYCSPLAVCSVELTEEGMPSNISLNELFKPERSESKTSSTVNGIAPPCKCSNSRCMYLTSKGKKLSKCLVCCSHRKKAQSSSDKQFGCPLCSAKFTQKCHVKRHMLTHTGERPFLCPVCGAKFALNCNFKNHMLIHSGEKPNSCSVCGARFMRASNLKEHMMFHSSVKPFQCTVCKARFTLKSHLKRHVFTHTGEKPFVCSVCGVGFSRRGNVKDHMKTHTGEKPFDCLVCGSRFSRRSHVKEHMLTHKDKSLQGVD